MKKLKVILQNPIINRYLLNSSWMVAEQVLRIISGVFVGIYIARYLGPEQFGILSYVLAVAAIAIAISRLGMDAVLVRELVSTPEKQNQLLGTAFWLMITAVIACYTLVVLAVWVADEKEIVKTYALTAVAGTAFTSFLSIAYFFQSKVKAKYSTICKVLTLAAMSTFKIGLILINADLLWFVLASVFDHALLAVCLIATMRKKYNIDFFFQFDSTVVPNLLRSAWPMVVAAVAGTILMRIDQVMIRNMLDLQQVGIYSAAVKVYEAWIVLPYIISVSLLPAIVQLRKGSKDIYHQRLTQLFRLLIWLSIIAASITTIFSEPLMVIAFGESYRGSHTVLNIVMWTAAFTAMGSLSARYYNVEHMERKILTRALVAAVLNIALNLILIPRYGIVGAAFSTLLCTFFANYVMDWFDKDLKELLHIKNRAIFANPFRQGNL